MLRTFPSAVIENLQPLIDGGRYPVKRVIGEDLIVEADIFKEGHDVVAAALKWRMVGENLAYSNGYINPVAASMHGWMESPGHRRNLLDPEWRQTAIGVWISPNGTVYFTEIFLTQ